MTTPMAEDTPLMRARNSYQGNDVEHQGDATFEEVQDTNSARSSKSRLLVAMALLAGFAVAGFSGGLRAGTAQAWGWDGMMPSEHHHHQKHSTKAPVNATALIKQGEAKAEQDLIDLQAEEAKLKQDEASQLQSGKSGIESGLQAALDKAEKEMEKEKATEQAREEAALENKLVKTLKVEIAELEAEKEAVKENEASLKVQEEEESALEAKYNQLHAKQSVLRTKEESDVQNTGER
mmetsp:Transcript_11822/g.17249  ORF Transcript_11822/g.17249 Transcript_11822/m.17249 type:complete len:236 (+) Transcript_11822:96-803(+)